MTGTADIARAAARLRGTVETITAELVERLENAPHFPADAATPRDRAIHRREVHDNQLAVDARRHWLTLEFARRHGWTFERGDHFTQPMLAEHRKRRGPQDEAFAYYEWADHSHYLRTPEGYPAAVVAHPYGGAFDPAADLDVDDLSGLKVTFPTDFPSWWYPGRTTLVLFERA